MDTNNSEFIVENELNESNFSDVSSAIGMDLKEMVEKIRKLENLAKKNAQCDTRNGDQSGMMQMGLQIGEKFGELKKENEGLKNEMAKMMKDFEELKKANDELKVENAEKGHEMERMKKENAEGIVKMSKIFEELHEKVEKLVEENSKMKEENAEKCLELNEIKKEIDGLKAAKAVDVEHRAFEELKKKIDAN